MKYLAGSHLKGKSLTEKIQENTQLILKTLNGGKMLTANEIARAINVSVAGFYRKNQSSSSWMALTYLLDKGDILRTVTEGGKVSRYYLSEPFKNKIPENFYKHVAPPLEIKIDEELDISRILHKALGKSLYKDALKTVKAEIASKNLEIVNLKIRIKYLEDELRKSPNNSQKLFEEYREEDAKFA